MMEALTDDCFALLLAELAHVDSERSDNLHHVWLRRTLPLVSRQWAELLSRPNPAYEHVYVDAACEQQFSRRLSRGSREACPSPTSGRSSPTFRRTLARAIDTEALLRWLKMRALGVKHLTVNCPQHEFSRRDLDQMFSMLKRSLRSLHWTGELNADACEAVGTLRQIVALRVSKASESVLAALGSLEYLPKLQQLELELERLPTYASRVRDVPSHLTHLALGNVWLTELPRALEGLKHLQKLSLHGCIIDADPLPLCSSLPALQELDISELHTFAEASPRFSPSGSITSLRLSSSGVQQLCPSIIELKSLRVLDLSHNPCMGASPQACLPQGLQQLEQLERLSLADSGLTAVPQVVLALPGLKQLNLQANSLTSVPAASPAFSLGLHTLDIRANRLAALPPLVLQCRQLAVLMCSSSALAGCPQSEQLAAHLPALVLLVVGGATHDSRAVRQLLALAQHAASLSRQLDIQLMD